MDIITQVPVQHDAIKYLQSKSVALKLTSSLIRADLFELVLIYGVLDFTLQHVLHPELLAFFGFCEPHFCNFLYLFKMQNFHLNAFPS